MRAALLVLLISGCGASGLTIANHVGLVVQSSALACDWGQTRRAAEAGWQRQREDNPIMGRTPTAAAVDAYFLAAIALGGLAWHTLPRRWKLAAPILITALEVGSLQHNLTQRNLDLGACGMR